MKITDIKIYPLKKKGDSKVKAFASVTLDKTVCITGIRIIEGSKGAFISFPQQKGSDEEYHDIVFPVTKEAREVFQKKVIEAFKKAGTAEAEDEVPFS